MYRSMVGVSLVVLTALAWQQEGPEPMIPLRGAEMTVEWTPGQAAVLRITAESDEALTGVRVFQPGGLELIDLEAPRRSPGGMTSLDIELHQPDLEALRASYAEGAYSVRAAMPDGRVAQGRAVFSCEMPAPPLVLHPVPGQVVRARNLTVLWTADPGVEAYELQVEQDEDDGIRIRLPPEQSSFRIPFRLLTPGRETHVELAAIGANGNRTLTEVSFFPAP